MRLFDPSLAVTADALDDVERLRIAQANRLGVLTRPADQVDADGVARGFGLTAEHPAIAAATAVLDGLLAVEHATQLELQRRMRAHPLGEWVRATNGLGLKQTGRLLGTIGDPYWHAAAGRPRTVSALWAYCGLHVVAGPDGAGSAPRLRRGQRANWSPQARVRAYLIATSCVKQAASPYRVTYLARREHTAVTRPEWTPGHSHADGLRIVAKAVVRDLWRESARCYGVDPDAGRPPTSGVVEGRPADRAG